MPPCAGACARRMHASDAAEPTTTALNGHRTACARSEDLPGPRGWPLLGNTLAGPARRASISTWSGGRASSGRCFASASGAAQQLVIADHELLSTVMRDRPEGFRRSPFTSHIGAEMGLPQGLFSAEGEDWRKQRRMVMASFAPGHVRAYFPSLVKVTLRLQGRWRKAAREQRDDPAAGRPDALHRRCHRRAGLRQGHQHARSRRGRDPAATSTRCCRRSSAACSSLRAHLALVQAARPTASSSTAWR